MWDVALRSLAHDRGKLAASLLGVALATTLVLVMVGLFVGFLDTSSSVVRRVGGDVWVMGRGVEVFDNGVPLSAATRQKVSAHSCARHVQALVVSTLPATKRTGAREPVQVIGLESIRGDLNPFPWNFAVGTPMDLDGPGRLAVDEHELSKLDLVGDPRSASGGVLGAPLEVMGRRGKVAAITEGIRSFALFPYVFAHIEEARRLSRLGQDQSHYLVVTVGNRANTSGSGSSGDAACIASLIHDLDGGALRVETMQRFASRTERYWVFGSGAGAAIGFSAIFCLFVGAVVVGQTLYSITKEHLRELATLKAMGATTGELLGFVATQAAFLATVGASLGYGIAFSLRGVLSSQGIAVSLSPTVLQIGAFSVVLMCLMASIPSARRVMSVDPAEVFR